MMTRSRAVKRLIVGLGALFLLSCAGVQRTEPTAIPLEKSCEEEYDWIKHPGKVKEAGFLFAVGVSEQQSTKQMALKDADENARAQLSAPLNGVLVEQKFDSQKKDQGSQFSSNYDSRLTTYTKGVVKRAERVDYCVDLIPSNPILYQAYVLMKAQDIEALEPWIFTVPPPDKHNFMSFVGISEGKESAQSAETDAFEHAKPMVRQYLRGSPNTDQLVQGLVKVDSSKQCTIPRDGRYYCFVLTQISKDSLEAEINRMRERANP